MKEKRILGIDYGEKRVGIAISDASMLIASPLRTANRGRFEEVLTGILDEYCIEAIVVGHPLCMNGTRGKRAVAAEDFARHIERRFSMTVILWDERFSTQDAERAMHEMDEKPSKNKAKVDRIAAALMLQSYLDSHKR